MHVLPIKVYADTGFPVIYPVVSIHRMANLQLHNNILSTKVIHCNDKGVSGVTHS